MVQGVFGSILILAIAWILCEDRKHIIWRPVIGGIVLQWLLAIILLKSPGSRSIFFLLDDLVDGLQKATDAGTSFVFGYLGGATPPFEVVRPAAGFILALKALPLAIVISALSSLLFYWGIMQRVVAVFALLLRRILGIGGALGFGAAVHIFVGMVEAPLLVRPYLARLSRGELFALMTVGMAGIAGTMMVIYAGILGPVIPEALGNILIASVISTPAGLAVAGLMIPIKTSGDATAPDADEEDPPLSSLDALVRGTQTGTMLVVGIVTLLIVVVSLVTMVNLALATLPAVAGEPVTIQRALAVILRPIAWAMGVPWAQSATAASLMGTKLVLTELVAYLDLAALPTDALDDRSRRILLYALCGFANLPSAGIMIGGLGAMVPERRREVAELGLRSVISGMLATSLSGAVAGVL